MSDFPSDALATSLAQLRLATAGQVRSVAPLVRRLAGELTHFDSVWVDALAQARILTRFQAAEINAGRGAGLQMGGYLLSAALPGPAYARVFAAADFESRLPARLLVADRYAKAPAETAAALQRLVERSRLVEHPTLAVVARAGVNHGCAWAASSPVEGVTAARWMTENGRFPGGVVLHIARQLAAALAHLERLEILHGDLSALGLIVRPDGRALLTHPGVRPIVRPMEGYAFGDLQPEAYDTLAPERIAEAIGVSIATEIYAFGCLAWNLATGRPPFAGGSTIAKLKAVHEAKAVDVARLAPDLPLPLARAIRACMAVSPAERPPSFAALSEILGSTTRRERHAARQQLARPQGPQRLWAQRRPASRGQSVAGVATVCVSLALLFAGSIAWRYRAESIRRLEQQGVAANGSAASSVRPRKIARNLAAPIATKTEAAKSTDADKLATETSEFDVATIDASADRGVRQATHIASRPPVEPRLLPTGRPLRLSELRLLRGQTARGSQGRPLVVVTGEGLRVSGEAIALENIDFVWDGVDAEEIGGAAGSPTEKTLAVDSQRAAPVILRLSAEQAEFRGCTFHDARRRKPGNWKGQPAPTAICWEVPPAAGDRAISTAGQLTVDNCVFWTVDAAIECSASASLAIESRQTLHALSGPWLRLTACPRRSQTVSLELTNATCRASSAVLECPSPPDAAENFLEPSAARNRSRGADARWDVGRISVQAVDSVFALHSVGALLLFDGPTPPRRLLGHVEWTGQGSLVTPSSSIAAWRNDAGAGPEMLAEDDVEVAGLVRSQIQFFGDAYDGPEAARLRRWQAPLRSSEPPGVGPGRVALPDLGALTP